MNEKTNDIVSWAVRDATCWTVERAMSDIVDWPVDWPVNGLVYNAVSNAAYRAVNWVVHGVRQSNSMHPALQEFLYSCGTEMEV